MGRVGRATPVAEIGSWGGARTLLSLIAAALVGAPSLNAHAPSVAAQEGDTAKQEESPREPRPPARRRAIAGLGGFVSRSKVVYTVLPETPYLLEATYVFPERSRWLLEPWPTSEGDGAETEAPDRRQRNLRFQFGEAIWGVEPGKLESRTYAGDERRLARLQHELRRVAMIWPAEHEWVTDGETRMTEIEGLGLLVATLDANGRPREIASRDADGTIRERIANIRWNAPDSEGARAWPASWDFHFGAPLIWSETIQSVQVAGKLSELHFLPPDRRGPGARVSLPPGAVQRIDLPAALAWTQDLEESARASWPLALAAARTALARWQATLGHDQLAPRPIFHLDSAGRPIRLELRLLAPPAELPEGWQRTEPGPAMRQIQPGLDGIDAAAIAALGKELEEAERPGPAHLVVQLVGEGAGLTQLVVPIRQRP